MTLTNRDWSRVFDLPFEVGRHKADPCPIINVMSHRLCQWLRTKAIGGGRSRMPYMCETYNAHVQNVQAANPDLEGTRAAENTPACAAHTGTYYI